MGLGNRPEDPGSGSYGLSRIAGPVVLVSLLLTTSPPQFGWGAEEKPSGWSNFFYRFAETFNDYPLHTATRSGRVDDVQRLLDEGADPNEFNDNGFAPLHLAAWKNQEEAAKLLVESGAVIDLRETANLGTPLLIAAQHDRLEMVRFLLKQGADREASDLNGHHALALAAGNGSTETLVHLLDVGMDVDMETDDGRTPLFVASCVGEMESARVLLEHGANLEAKTWNGYSSLSGAAFYGQSEMVSFLLDHGESKQEEDLDHPLLLLNAAAGGHTGVARELIERGFDPNSRLFDGGPTALHMAAKGGHGEVVRLLADNGSFLELATWRGMTPLHYGMLSGHCKVVDLLVTAGADSGMVDQYGMTADEVADLARTMNDSQLHEVEFGDYGFNPMAVLPLFGFVTHSTGFYIESSGISFAIGDGTYLVTAAHCVDHFVSQATSESLLTPFVLSHYHGDFFEVEVVSMDMERDVALLKAGWGGHPSFTLVPAGEVSHATELLVAGYPSVDQNYEIGVIPRQVCLERLSLIRHDPEAKGRAIIMGGGRHVGPGWSGSPIILPDTDRVAGVFGSHNYEMHGDDYLFHDLMGSDNLPILRLLENETIDIGLFERNGESPQSIHASECCEIIFEYLAFNDDYESELAMESLQEWSRLDPDSFACHLFTAWELIMAMDLEEDNPELEETAGEHVSRLVELSPQSQVAGAAHLSYLTIMSRHTEALEFFKSFEDRISSHPLFQVLELENLAAADPDMAIEKGETILQAFGEPESHWFELSGVLRDNGHYEQGLIAIEKAMEGGKDFTNYYRPRLANILAHVGHHSDAEEVYDLILEEDPDNPLYWFWFAEFLADHPEGRKQEAREALQKVTSLDNLEMVSESDRGRVWEKLGRGTEQTNGSSE